MQLKQKLHVAIARSKHLQQSIAKHISSTALDVRTYASKRGAGESREKQKKAGRKNAEVVQRDSSRNRINGKVKTYAVQPAWPVLVRLRS